MDKVRYGIPLKQINVNSLESDLGIPNDSDCSVDRKFGKFISPISVDAQRVNSLNSNSEY